MGNTPLDRTSVTPPRHGSTHTSTLLAAGATGAALFVLVFLVESVLHPTGFDPLVHTVSAFVLGPHGWIQRVSFLVCGGLIAAGGIGLRTTWPRQGGGRLVPLLVVVLGVGLMGAGIFAADPVAAGVAAAAPYPPGLPVPQGRTATGVLHDLGGTPLFVGLPIMAAAAAYRYHRAGRRFWSAWSLGTAVGFLALFIATSATLAPGRGLPMIGGLLQRLTLIVGLSWLAGSCCRGGSTHKAWSDPRRSARFRQVAREPTVIGSTITQGSQAAVTGCAQLSGRVSIA